MKHYQVAVTLMIDFDAENQKVADYAIQNIEVALRFPQYTKVKLVNSEEDWGETLEVDNGNKRRPQ